MPRISIGIASGSLPTSTVQAYPFMPGLMSASLKIWTFPALGRTGAGAWPNMRDEQANAPARAANFCIGPSLYFRMRSTIWVLFLLSSRFSKSGKLPARRWKLGLRIGVIGVVAAAGVLIQFRGFFGRLIAGLRRMDR